MPVRFTLIALSAVKETNAGFYFFLMSVCSSVTGKVVGVETPASIKGF
jgi:hypothetical protein